MMNYYDFKKYIMVLGVIIFQTLIACSDYLVADIFRVTLHMPHYLRTKKIFLEKFLENSEVNHQVKKIYKAEQKRDAI